MKYPRMRVVIAACLSTAAAVVVNLAAQPQGRGLRVEISFAAGARAEPVTGMVYLAISKDNQQAPIQQTDPEGVPLFSAFVQNLAPGAPAIITRENRGHPVASLADIPAGEYWVQPFVNVYTRFPRSDGHTVWMHMDQWEGQNWKRSPGNLYGDPVKMRIDPASTTPIQLVANKVIPPITPPADTAMVKRIKIQSQILTKWWGQPIYLGATVLLPKDYDKHPEVKYPVNYIQGHFSLRAPGGFGTGGDFDKLWLADDTPRFIYVTLQHPSPYYDDSYGVNSANMGPYGDAITQELIPFIEETFRGIGQPWARMLTGCSTGGWASLGMQMFYPDFYNGEWTGAPSSIDFRASRLVNLYTYANAYYYNSIWGRVPIPAEGNRGPANVAPGRRMEDDQIIATMEQQNHYELVLGDRGRGAQLFDVRQALYGPVGADGYPAPIWDKMTGEINRDVVAYWREHSDLAHILRRDWATLGPKLVGKIHLAGGTDDQYFVANGIRYLADFLLNTKEPSFDGTVEYGDRQIHCYNGGDSDRPTSELGQSVFQRQMPLMQERMLKTAPRGADVTSWRY